MMTTGSFLIQNTSEDEMQRSLRTILDLADAYAIAAREAGQNENNSHSSVTMADLEETQARNMLLQGLDDLLHNLESV